MKIHHYHPETGAHLCTADAEADPLELDLARHRAFEEVLAEAREGAPDDALIERAKAAAEAVQPTVFLLPAHATKVAPPKLKAAQRAVHRDGAWTVEAVAAEPEEAAEISEDERAWDQLRGERSRRLHDALAMLERHRTQTDFGLPTTLTADQAKAWAVYAQALRDLPAACADPKAVAWPQQP